MTSSLQGSGMTSPRTRERMVARLAEQGISNPQLLDVMRKVPRHIFVAEALASRAYDDDALPIGYGQTISHPYTVAKMTELLLENGPLTKVLEIGTGCGYQTAVLAQLVGKVYTVERILPLQRVARSHMYDLLIKNISYMHSDGGWGWADYAPYDGILVSAAPLEIPQMLLEQMAVGGVMVIPTGVSGGSQVLKRVTRTASDYKIEDFGKVSFVPFKSGKEQG
ncbi:protein-L-isoaspartate(D-aspartate) O-methyltransferase [Methylosoma difficile]